MPFGFLIGGLATGIGSIVSGAMGSSAAKEAAKIQAQSAENALAFQKQVYATEQQQMSPYLAAGGQALSTLTGEMGQLTKPFNPTEYGLPAQFSYSAKDFQVDPGYQFALQQGQQAIERSAAARGGAVSGGVLKDLTQYSQGMAEQQYNTAYQRAFQTYQQNYSNLFNTYETNQQNRFNRLNALVGTGQNAVAGSAQAGQQYAAAAGNYAIGAGNAQAAGEVGAANAWANALSGVAKGITGSVNSYANYQYQNNLLNALAAYRSSAALSGNSPFQISIGGGGGGNTGGDWGPMPEPYGYG